MKGGGWLTFICTTKTSRFIIILERGTREYVGYEVTRIDECDALSQVKHRRKKSEINQNLSRVSVQNLD